MTFSADNGNRLEPDSAETKACREQPEKPASAWWMNVDQYAADACRCRLPEGHGGPHECEHDTWERSLVY